MDCGTIHTAWAGVELSEVEPGDALPSEGTASWFGLAAAVEIVAATDPFDDFDDDDFDDEFDDDFEEEWDEELPGDADQFEPDEVQVEEKDDDLPVEPEFEDED